MAKQKNESWKWENLENVDNGITKVSRQWLRFVANVGDFRRRMKAT